MMFFVSKKTSHFCEKNCEGLEYFQKKNYEGLEYL